MNDTQKKRALPRTVTELIEQLDEMYPDKCIGKDESLREADRRAGARELVEGLLSRLNKDTGVPSLSINHVVVGRVNRK